MNRVQMSVFTIFTISFTFTSWIHFANIILAEVWLIPLVCDLDYSLGKLGRYFWTSSSAEWSKRSMNLIFHLFNQFQWEKLLMHWNWINRWKIYFAFFSFGGTSGWTYTTGCKAGMRRVYRKAPYVTYVAACLCL